MSKRAQSNSAKSPNKTWRRLVHSFAILAVFALAWLLVSQQQTIRDYYRLQTFSVDDVMATIAQRTTLTELGEHYFYVSHPLLLSKEGFNSKCERREADSPILGCYTADQTIYLYNIQNADLDGIVEVTAAHEMLHAAWDRLSAKERGTLEAQLLAAYDTLDNSSLEQRMEYYERQEPGAKINELHSILGTEVAQLPAELEEYYARYFSDRGAVITLYRSYQSVFDSITERSQTISDKLTAMRPTIEGEVWQYNSDAATIAAAFDRLDADRTTIDRTDGAAVAVFNQRVESLNSQAAELGRRRVAINTDIATYNKLAAELNDINLESSELTASIDSLSSDD